MLGWKRNKVRKRPKVEENHIKDNRLAAQMTHF